MAKGDYTLITDTPSQSVTSHPRRYGVMFNPSSSRSRLHIVDSGRRYGVRLLADGMVQYSLDGDLTWRPIQPLLDPCTGQTLPAFLSHDETRAGRALDPVRFDMIAVGRGRILAKEAGTNRIFHIIMDELFRTHRVTGADCNIDVNVGSRSEDPPVPGFYMKLDPEYFVPGPPSLVVPPEAQRKYADHPASLRLPVFAQLLELGISDVMLVMQHARTWYLVDARSPRSIVGPEDLRFTEEDFKAVFTKPVLHDILKTAEQALEAGIAGAIRQWIEDQLRQLFPNVQTNDLRASFAALGPIGDLLTNLIAEVVRWLSASTAPWLAEQIATAIPKALVDLLAHDVAASIQKEGYGALVLPVYVALGFVLYGARASKALKTDSDGTLRLDPRVLAGNFPENRPLSDAIAKLMLRSRRRAFGELPPNWPEWMPTANQPPAWMPTYLHSHFVSKEVGALPAGARQAAVAPLPDGRLELWVVDASGGLSTTWKVSAQPNANWSPWENFLAEVGALPAGARQVAVATLPDGRLELWVTDASGDLFTTWKVSTQPNADWTPWTALVRHGGEGPEQRFGIQFSKVLDLGVGYSHWSEQWLKHFGGEIHSLLATRPLFQQERYNLTQYRFLNGPVVDGDAFNDGTTNFYLLVKLGPADSTKTGLRQHYAILWIDEQTYFTQRWRLLHPTDDVLGDLFSLSHTLKDHPEWFHFSLGRFWSPFTDDLVNDDSRMAVRRQIVALTGFDRTAQRHEIYTICFNYGVSDHTWRWRLFPRGEQVVIDSATAHDLAPQFPAVMTNGPASAYVAVNTLDLRDDTTLHVRGTMRTSGTTPLRLGRWVQRYLPADCRHVPAPHQLTGGKPAAGYGHGWDFVSETAYRRADRFYQFGVYEDRLDSRCQYYEVELLPGANGELPRVEDVVGSVWRNDVEVASGDRLLINTTNFVWSLPKNADGAIAISPGGLVRDRRDLPTMSMYEETTRFRLLERKPLGLIAVFYDKRDDDLQSATDLPHATIFREDFAEAAIPVEWENETGGRGLPPPPPPSPPRNLRLLVNANRRVLLPPVVRKACVVHGKAPGLGTLHVSFWTPQTEQEVYENLWKVSLAAIDDTGVVPIFSLTLFPNFVRRAVPDAPLPFDFAGDLGDAWRYDCDWKVPREMSGLVDRFCTPEGHIEYATSLWFEDVVGHRSIAQEIVFILKPASGWAWGASGRLGDGSTTNRSTPGPVSALTELVAIAAGGNHNLALTVDESLWAWGLNSSGELGDGTTTDRLTPVQITGLGPLKAIAAGNTHSLVLKADGTVWSWGLNTYGQLGDGTTTQRLTPVQVQGLTSVVAISAGKEQNMVLKADGTVWAWGYNAYGNLGDGTRTQRLIPVQVQGLTNVVAMAYGGGSGHGVALKADGTVWAWGNNTLGQVGNGAVSVAQATPVQVGGLANVVAIAAGDAHSLALESDGTVWAWGVNDSAPWAAGCNGQLGDGTTTNRLIPVQVHGLTGVAAIAGGGSHSLALKSDGTVWAWGCNNMGQLGDGTTTNRLTPVQVQRLTAVVALAAGGWHSLALTEAPM